MTTKISRGGLFNAACAIAVAAPLLLGRYGWPADAAGGVFLAALLLDAAPAIAGLARKNLPAVWSDASGALAAAAVGVMAFVATQAPVPSAMQTVAALAALGQAALALESEASVVAARWRAGLALAPLALALALKAEPVAYIGLAATAALALAFLPLARRARRARQVELEARGRLASALNGVGPCFGLFDAELRLVSGNQGLYRLFKLSAEQALGQSLGDLLLKKLALPLVEAGERKRLADAALVARKKRDKSALSVVLVGGRVMEFVFAPVPDGLSLQMEDVTQLRAEEARVARLAGTDDVTGMANRAAFRDILEKAATEADQNPFAIFMVDLDRFKQVNDTLGHAAGDKLLTRVAKRLMDLSGEGEEVARLGGDEFVVLTRMDREAAGLFAARIVETIGEPYQIEGSKLLIGASVGVALAPEDSSDASELMKAADMALYAAKDGGRGGWRYFCRDMGEKARRRQQIEQDLRIGIGRNELEVHYQPIVSFAKRRICCCEALVRWRHPTQGLISPALFIPIAEESGLIAPLGEFVLRQACEDAKAWPRSVRVAVNFSAHQFARGDVAEMVRRILRETKFPPGRLEAEITELALMSDADNVLNTLDELREMGVRVALDDFGTGYSSLAYLSRFRPDKVKIDQSFVRDMAKNGAALAIIKAVKALVVELGIDMLVEGVETQEQLEILRANGADEAQGYLFSKPRPANEVARLVADPSQLPRARKINNQADAAWTRPFERVDPLVAKQLN